MKKEKINYDGKLDFESKYLNGKETNLMRKKHIAGTEPRNTIFVFQDI